MAINLRWWRRRHTADLGEAGGERVQDALPAPIPLPLPQRPAAEAPAPPGGFRIEGRRVGVLLVHGLTSTPLSMQPLGMALSRHGLDVEAVLLPGHGTRAESLVGVKWQDWYACVQEAVTSMRSRYDRVIVCGQSLGGSLALHLAAEEAVHGVITLAGIAYLRDWRLRFLPLLSWMKHWRRSPGNDIAKRDTQDQGSYERMPMSAIQELLELAKQVRQDLPKVSAPALVIQSAVDHVVHSKNADFIHDRLGSRRKELVRLQRSYHVISLDNDFELVVDRIVRFVRRVGFDR